jgi:hypothetical protein
LLILAFLPLDSSEEGVILTMFPEIERRTLKKLKKEKSPNEAAKVLEELVFSNE